VLRDEITSFWSQPCGKHCVVLLLLHGATCISCAAGGGSVTGRCLLLLLLLRRVPGRQECSLLQVHEAPIVQLPDGQAGHSLVHLRQQQQQQQQQMQGQLVELLMLGVHDALQVADLIIQAAVQQTVQIKPDV
jgi:hypothetical protein